MKAFIFLQILLVFVPISYGKNIYQTIDKAAFYAVLKTGNVDDINNELATITGESFKEKQAYEGALLMRKAGLLKKPKDKLTVFKEGATKLEAAISNDNENVEYRFLRLIIQEHAPKILKYNKQIDSDSELIKSNYKTLQPAVQQALIDYAKTSEKLHPQDFD